MSDRRGHQLSLYGQVVEDLSFEGLPARRFAAVVLDPPRQAVRKEGGFFAFANLPAGEHTVEIGGERLQPRRFQVTLPADPPLLDEPGGNELIVIATAIDHGETPESEKRIAFDPVNLQHRIRAGAPVLASGLETQLTADLEPGSAGIAKLESVEGLSPGALVRIVRDRSIRLRHDPYAELPPGFTRLVGRVTLATLPEVAVAAATVRLTRVAGTDLVLNHVAGGVIATVVAGGKQRVLGTADDVAAETNAKGDYNLYFPAADFWTGVTLEVARSGFKTETRTENVAPGERKKIDFALERL